MESYSIHGNASIEMSAYPIVAEHMRVAGFKLANYELLSSSGPESERLDFTGVARLTYERGEDDALESFTVDRVEWRPRDPAAAPEPEPPRAPRRRRNPR